MFIIGVDPHRGSHVAVVLDDHEQIHDELAVTANRLQRQRLLDWAAGYQPRVWAIEGAAGTGALLAQQLVAAGEDVVDVPPALAARVRLLDNEQRSKTDRHDARSVAVAARRKRGLRHVAIEDHVAVLRLLAKRHHDLIAGRTRTVCRLHSTLCYLAEGHFPKRLRADQAAAILARIQPHTEIARQRKHDAREHLAELRRFDRALVELEQRIRCAVTASGSSVTAVHGVGPIMAAYLSYRVQIPEYGNANLYPTYGTLEFRLPRLERDLGGELASWIATRIAALPGGTASSSFPSVRAQQGVEHWNSHVAPCLDEILDRLFVTTDHKRRL
jgi:transposase